MKITMRWLLAVAVVLALGTVAPNTVLGQAEQPGEPRQSEQPGQAEQPAQPEQPGQAESESAQPITGLELEGELRAVDTDQRIFLIVGENGNEMLFHYDDATEVVGQAEGVQGLTGQSGTWVRIEYRAEGQEAIAERIEIGERPEGAEAPQSSDQPEGQAPQSDPPRAEDPNL